MNLNGNVDNMVENNILIALFMGWRIDNSFPDKYRVYRGPTGGLELDTTFKYHTSWEWLMPVIDKIENLDVGDDYYRDVFVIMKKSTCKIYVQVNSINDKYAYEEYYHKGSFIENTYKGVVDFIKWYNNNK